MNHYNCNLLIVNLLMVEQNVYVYAIYYSKKIERLSSGWRE